MTVDTVTIIKHEEHPQWFRLTIVSWQNSIGRTSIEMLVTQDTLRALSREISKHLPQPLQTNDRLPFLNED
jgi:hypothetical protein